jgi:uncharacterized iron-regulated membrane protein
MKQFMTLQALHRYVAFAGIAVFLVLGATGSLLLFRSDLEHMLHPERRLAAVPVEGLRYQRVLEAARRAAPGAQAWRINPPANLVHAVQVLAEGPDEMLLFLHPSSGQILSSGAVHEYPVDWMLELHIELLAGPVGKFVVFLTGIALLALVATGLALWWPRTLRAAFRYRLSQAAPLFHFELHRLAGILGGPALAAGALTGVLLVYPEQSMQTVRWLSGQRTVFSGVASTARGSLAVDLDQIVAAANTALPQGRVTRVIVPASGAPVIVRKRTEDEHHPNGLHLIAVDQASATVLSAVPAHTAHISIRMWEWIYPLHIGTLFGPLNKTLVFLTGVLPILMGMTGILVWWHRRRAKRRRSAHSLRASQDGMSR